MNGNSQDNHKAKAGVKPNEIKQEDEDLALHPHSVPAHPSSNCNCNEVMDKLESIMEDFSMDPITNQFSEIGE